MLNIPLIKWFDKLVVKVWKLEATDNKMYVKARRSGDTDTGGAVYDMGVIDSKSSALLSHTSIILAVLGILINIGGPAKIFFVIEFVLYAALATLLLRCVDILGPPYRPLVNDTEDLADYWHLEALIRRTIYQFVLRGVIFLSFFLIVSVIYSGITAIF